MKIIKGKDINIAIKEEINLLKTQIKTDKPSATIIRVGKNSNDITYQNAITNVFSKLDINVENINFNNNVSTEEFFNKIEELNNDNDVHGIMILRPLPQQIDENYLSQILNYRKDIDGISDVNIAKLYSNHSDALIPCTPQAVLAVLKYLNIDLVGKDITLVGAGMAVGRPLALLLLNHKATITITHKDTKDLKRECLKADIIVAAAGSKHLIKDDFVKEDAIVIDVGINVENNKLYGDVDFEQVSAKAKYITPVPGGIGSITTTILALQLFKAIINQEKER